MIKPLLEKLTPYFSYPIVWVSSGLALCLLSLCITISSEKRVTQLEEKAYFLQKRKNLAQAKEAREEKLLSQLKAADPSYVESQIESLQFLSPEIKQLQALLYTNPQNQTASSRLKTLSGKENRAHFRQSHFEKVGTVGQVELTLDRPVEMNGQDLKTFLTRIENVSIDGALPRSGSPYLVIEKFDMERKVLPSKEESYLVRCKLIKREYLNE